MSRQDQPIVCGWCITGHHESCKPEGSYYEQTWRCQCAVCHPTKPTKKTRKKA